MNEISPGPYGADTGFWSEDCDEYGNRFPETKYGERLSLRHPDGASAGEMIVEVDSPGGAIDYVEMERVLGSSQPIDGADELIEESTLYLEEIRKAEEILKETHPIFSEVIVGWVETQIVSERCEHNCAEQYRIYGSLLSELAAEYQPAIDGGDMPALAEWDVIRSIIEMKRYELKLSARLEDLVVAT